MKIGFIGQGYVGKNYADNFKARGFEVVRYSLEEEYKGNKAHLAECSTIFIAVPTPTTFKGFDISIVNEALSYIQPGTVVVIKSTMPPGSTDNFQRVYPKLTILFSPEFLREATARQDVDNPPITIIGSSHPTEAATILELLPASPYVICKSAEAELYKYIQNVNGYFQIVMFNLFYDFAERFNIKWDTIQNILDIDPTMSARFASPIHNGGRGAGGSCLIKDFATFEKLYKQMDDPEGLAVIRTVADKNISLLIKSNKSLEHVKSVY